MPREAGTEEEALSTAPFRGEARELTTSGPSEREGTENPQWREDANGVRTIGGWVWEGAKLPPSGARKRKLSGPPLGARPEN